MNGRIASAVLIVLSAATVRAAPAQLEVRVGIEDDAGLEVLSRLVAVEDVEGDAAIVTILPSQLAELEAHGFRVEILTSPKTAAATMCGSGWEHESEPSWDCYPAYGQYVAFLERLAADYPTTCRLVDLGPTTNTANPHRLFVLEIGEHPGVEREIPEVLLTSTMHGDETAGFVLLLRLAFLLVDNYGVDPEVTGLLRDTEIWINPLANPDGTYFGGNHTVASAIRFFTSPTGAATAVNPNRNYPDPDAGPHPDGNPWWLETEAMMDFGERHSFTLSVNLHGGAELVNYPWDTWCDRHPDDAWLVDIATSWATSAQQNGPPGYMDDCKTPRCTTRPCTPGVTHGADWYPVAGGRQDYMTYYRSGRELTVEISSQKLLPSDQLDEIWQANYRAFLEFLHQAQRGIHGSVHDPDGDPIAARIDLIGIDTPKARSWVATDPDVGDFHRLALPGTYDVQISAAGFEPKTLTGITVPASAPFPSFDIELTPEPDPQVPEPRFSR